MNYSIIRMLTATFALITVAATSAQADPVVNELVATTVPQSGRILILGSGFGSAQGDGQVLLDGALAPVTKWTDGEIHAYVPGDMPVGPASLVVRDDAGATSQAVDMTVAPREPGDGRVRWRFQADSALILHRPAVAADGTVYLNDIGGDLYAISADGGLKWIFDTLAGGQGGGADGPVALGFDGTVYVEGDPLGPQTFIHAVNPDGTLKWTFVDPDGQGAISGPNVGPDGNLYVVTELPAFSAFSLTPDGELRWNVPGFVENGQVGAEIVFGAPDQLYFCHNGFFDAFRLDGNHEWTIDVGAQGRQVATGPGGAVYIEDDRVSFKRLAAFDADGNQQWTFFDLDTLAISLTAPDVGADGVIYIVRNTFNVHAIDPNGTSRWAVAASGSFGTGGADSENALSGPIVSPDNTQIVIGGNQGGGEPGAIRSWSTANGAELWDVQLPVENGIPITPHNRAMFAPDGQTVYVGTSGSPDEPQYSYLYAINAAEQPPVCPGGGTLIEGTGQTGDFNATCGSDDSYWAAHGSSLFFQIADPVVQFELTASAPAGFGGSTISVDIEASKQNANGNLNLRALLFNFTTGSYVALPGIMPLATTDAVQNFELPGGSDPADFIESGTSEVRLLLQTIQTSGLPNVRTQLDEVLFNFQ